MKPWLIGLSLLCPPLLTPLAANKPAALLLRLFNDAGHPITFNIQYRDSKGLWRQQSIAIPAGDVPEVLLPNVLPSSLAAPTAFWYFSQQQPDAIYYCENYFSYDPLYPDIKVYIYSNTRCVVS